jgi:hypothetical protein
MCPGRTCADATGSDCVCVSPSVYATNSTGFKLKALGTGASIGLTTSVNVMRRDAGSYAAHAVILVIHKHPNDLNGLVFVLS